MADYNSKIYSYPDSIIGEITPYYNRGTSKAREREIMFLDLIRECFDISPRDPDFLAKIDKMKRDLDEREILIKILSS